MSAAFTHRAPSCSWLIATAVPSATPAAVRDLERVVPVHMHWVAPDDLELAFDLDAGFFTQLPTGAFFGQLAPLDHASGKEPLTGQGRALRSLQ